MNRRQFLRAGLGCALAVPAQAQPGEENGAPPPEVERVGAGLRGLFPRLEHEVFLNAAAGTPLGTFAADGLRRYEDFWRHGRSGDRWPPVNEMLSQVGERFARLIGAQPSEIALVHCTKAGEQIVLDGLPALCRGGNVVTNDMHFGGSLHNLIGLRRAGLDVRIVRGDGWQVDPEAMAAAIDERTALVSVTLVSNVNGRIEDVRRLADLAHANGAYLYADIIQAAGIVPIDVAALGIDFAACSGYKWLFGPHGTGFLYVRQALQGTALEDRLFPGFARRVEPPAGAPQGALAGTPDGDLAYRPPTDARRYQPGHVSYLGYCALARGLELLEEVGVESALRHSLHLVARLRQRLDSERYPCVSPHADRSPIVTFTARDSAALEAPLRAANLAISLNRGSFRVSPALYNVEDDVDRLAEVLNGV